MRPSPLSISDRATEEMKFDVVVMNPPFCNGLHLRVLKEVIPHVNFDNGGEVLCIHPAKWVQFPTRERNTTDKNEKPVPHFLNGLIAGFDMVEREDANNMFGINDGDLVITDLKKDGMSFISDAVNDPQFCCFKFNSRFAANWKIVKSIYEKVVAKCPVGTYSLNLQKIQKLILRLDKITVWRLVIIIQMAVVMVLGVFDNFLIVV